MFFTEEKLNYNLIASRQNLNLKNLHVVSAQSFDFFLLPKAYTQHTCIIYILKPWSFCQLNETFNNNKNEGHTHTNSKN